MATFTEKGFGQVVPNRLLNIVTGDMESQAPYMTQINGGTGVPQCEQGTMLIVAGTTDTISGGVTRVAVEPSKGTGKETPYLVYSEVKLYDERQMVRDFINAAGVDKLLFPRLIKLAEGDVFTTNTVAEAALAVNEVLHVGDNGILTKTQATNKVFQFLITEVTKMPDGQKAVKLLVQKA